MIVIVIVIMLMVNCCIIGSRRSWKRPARRQRLYWTVMQCVPSTVGHLISKIASYNLILDLDLDCRLSILVNRHRCIWPRGWFRTHRSSASIISIIQLHILFILSSSINYFNSITQYELPIVGNGTKFQ